MWVQFVGLDTSALWKFIAANKEKYKLNFIGGARCVAQSDFGEVDADRWREYIRFSFAFYEEQELVEGVRRLAVAIEDFKKSG